MFKHRILIVEENSLFSNGVKMLLAMQQNLQIVGTAPAADADFLLAEISRTYPDAIIISDAFAQNHDELVLTLLNQVPDTKIITINLDDNRLNVISNKEITVKTTQDLVEAIIQ